MEKIENNLKINDSSNIEKNKNSEKQEKIPVKNGKSLEELEVKLKDMENKREMEKVEINKIREKLGLPIINEFLEKTDRNDNLNEKNQEHMKDTVKRVQDMFINAAEKYLPVGNQFRNQIIKFYSDTDRLSKELSNVFKGVEESDIDRKVEGVKEQLNDEKFFIKEVLSKDFSTSK